MVVAGLCSTDLSEVTVLHYLRPAVRSKASQGVLGGLRLLRAAGRLPHHLDAHGYIVVPELHQLGTRGQDRDERQMGIASLFRYLRYYHFGVHCCHFQ